MRLAANIWIGVVCALWAGLFWLGIDGMKNVKAQHVAGYPEAGQIFYYVKVPGIMIALLLFISLLSNFVIRDPLIRALLLIAIGVAAFFGIPVYLLPYGGGV